MGVGEKGAGDGIKGSGIWEKRELDIGVKGVGEKGVGQQSKS